MTPTITAGLIAPDRPGLPFVNADRIAQEEIFGPVVTIQGFDTHGEAVDRANATPYGLACSIWTRDLEQRVAGKTGLSAILGALDAHRDHVRRYPDHARAMNILWASSFDPASEFKPNVIEFHRLQRDAAAAWVVSGIQSGEIRNDIKPERFGEQFYASLLGINYQWLVNPEIDLDASIDVLKKNIVALLEAKKPLKQERK